MSSLAAAREFLATPAREKLALADKWRANRFGDEIELCSIIAIRSGACAMDCKFCAQSRLASGGSVFPLLPNAILREKILALAKTPVCHIGLVASGEALSEADFRRLLRLIADLPEEARERICLSIGRLKKGRLGEIKDAGVARAHHNLETSRSYYPRICSTQTWEARRKTVELALAEGLEVCSGALFGLGESREDRVELAISLKELGVKYIPLNFLDPRPGTFYEKANTPAIEDAAEAIALFRFLLPEATLRICGGRLRAFGENQARVFAAGANALMTGDFLTTSGESLKADIDLIKSAGLRLKSPDCASF